MRVFAITAALAAGALLPGQPLGAAVPVVAALMLATTVRGARVSRLRLALGLLAVALAAQAALLDAGWIVAIDLTLAWVLATFAAGGVSAVALAKPFERLRRVPDIVPRPSEEQRPLFHGLALGIVLLLPFVLLFLSADAAFAGLAGDIPLPSGDSLPARIGVTVAVLAGALGLGLTARARAAERRAFAHRRLSFFEWAIPLVFLNVLFLAFVAVQLAVLFGGNDRVLNTAGLTYSEYARSGFWQLLAAAALTFAVAGGALKLCESRSRRERFILRVLVGALCALTLVVLVSAVYRLRLYEDAFGLTRARLLAEAVALSIGVLLALVAAAAWSRSAQRHFAGTAVLVTAVGALIFSLANPDRRVAQQNVERWRETGRIDLVYLAGLSADAVPALVQLPPAPRERATAGIRERLAERDPWSSANRSRARARELLGR